MAANTDRSRINAYGVPGDLLSISTPNRNRPQNPQDMARAAGSIAPNIGVPWHDSAFSQSNLPTSPGRGGQAPNEMDQLRQALFSDYSAMQGANERNFQRGNIPIQGLMDTMRWDTAALERLGNEGASTLDPLDRQMADSDSQLQGLGRSIGGMERSADQSYNDVMGRLRKSDADINSGYGRQDAAEATMRGGIDEYRNKTMMEESSAADNIAGQVDSQIKQLNADPNLRPEEKAALRYQMKASIGPSVQKVVTDIGTRFNETMAQLKTTLASLQSEGAKLRVSGAQAKMYGTQIAASAGGQRTAAKGQATEQRMNLEMQRQKVRESRVALKQMQQQMREGAKMAALQARMNGNETLGRLIEMNPESPVSMAAVFAAMMAARSAPSYSGGGSRSNRNSNADPLFTTQGVGSSGGGMSGGPNPMQGTNWNEMGGNDRVWQQGQRPASAPAPSNQQWGAHGPDAG